MPQSKRILMNRLLNAYAVAFSVTGLLTLLVSDKIAYYFHLKGSVVFLIGPIFMLIGFGLLLFTYLKGDMFSADRTSKASYNDLVDRSSLSSLPDELRVVRKELAQLKDQVERVGDGPKYLKDLAPDEKASLRSELKTQLEGVLASDLVKEIELKYATQIADDAQISQIRKGFEITSLRLRQEIAALGRRSDVNLIIGVLTTVVAVALLAYLVWGSTVTFPNLRDLLSHFIPRISVAVFIEVFSFFFLKLYKSNLNEIKYFQNELTNVETKIIALEAALLGHKSKSIEPIIDQLIRTDRNMIALASNAERNNDIKHVEPKDLVDILDKLGKLLSLGGHK